MCDTTILHGDVLDKLATLPAASVHCVVTSPPYWGLRDYGTATWLGGDPACNHRNGGQVAQTIHPAEGHVSGVRPGVDATTCRKCGALRQDRQIGLEPTPAAYVARLVEVFAAVWRVLRDDGTLWLNLGDSYAGSGVHSANHANPGISNAGRRGADVATPVPTGLKPKDLVGIPWRVAFALQAAGWYLRSDCIWAKPNPMPESVTDRPTKAHEYLFLLTKRERYFYDAVAIKEGLAESTLADGRNGTGRHTQGINGSKYFADESPDEAKAGKPSWYRQKTFVNSAAGRNRRSVWTIATEPFSGAHFAVMPTKLVQPCILAGTSERGCCPVCGAPWERVRERTAQPATSAKGSKFDAGKTAINGNGRTQPGERYITQATGWQPTCTCPGLDGDAPWPDVTMHPDGAANWPACPAPSSTRSRAAGTTLAVAVGLGRHGIGIELNASYIALAEKRLYTVQRPMPLARLT